MPQPFIGEIRMFAGNFPPVDWFFCDGQLLPISYYETLFNLIGTTYGGDGIETFALPNLCGRVPIHAGLNYVQGETGGAETITLDNQQMPAHSHGLLAGTARGTPLFTASTGYLAATPGTKVYGLAGGGTADMAAQAIAPSFGGNQPHENMAPFLAINFIIATAGMYPQLN